MWGDIAACVEGHRGGAFVCVSELLVRAALPHFDEAQTLAEGTHLAWLEDGPVAHYATLMV